MAKSKKTEHRETTVSPDDMQNLNADDAFKRLAEELNQGIDNSDKLQDANSELAGFWASDKSPIVCVPLRAHAQDSQQDTLKSSVLLIVRLVAPCAVTRKNDDDEREPAIAPKDALVGVWYRPGMGRLAGFCGRVVSMRATDRVKKIPGKSKPMKIFDVKAEVGADTPIMVTADYRKKSRGRELPFALSAGATTPRGDKNLDADGDDVGEVDTSKYGF